MLKEFEKLLERKRKEGRPMDDLEQSAKMNSLNSLQGEMQGMMKDRLMKAKAGPASVEVASDNPEGLKEGLEKAHDMLEGSPEEESSESPDEESSEGSEEPHEGLSDEDIKMLEEVLAKAKASRMTD